MIEIRVLDAEETRAAHAGLCKILSACVNGGASLGFMLPYEEADAAPFFAAVTEAVARQEVLHVAAFVDGVIAGTVQVVLKMPPNQPHRGDLKKLLVHPDYRGLGLAKALMQRAEAEAEKRGKTLLVLDTATGSDADFIYPKLGWEKAGIIPDYALFPDGRFCDTTVYFRRLSAAS